MKRVLLVAALSCACSSTTAYVPTELTDRRPMPVLRAASGESTGADTEPPLPLPRKLRRMPSPTEARLSNGVRVILLERHDFPSVSVSFVVDRGGAAAAAGIAAVYAETIRGATPDYTSKEAFDYLGYIGAHTYSWASQDGAGIDVTALSPLMGGALFPVAAMFTSASFDSDDIKRARASTKAAAASERTSPSEIASRTLRRMVLGEEHPYARGLEAPTPERADKISRNDLENFRNMYVVPERVTAIAVGDFDRTAMLARLERLLSRLPKRKASEAPPIPAPRPLTRAQIAIVSRPGASQSNVALGFAGARRGDEARAALRVMSALLGRGLSGRLDLKVRGEHGYSYGVRVHDRAWREAGIFVVETAVDTAHTAESVKGLVSELGRLRTEPVDAAELARAKHQALDELATEDAAGQTLSSLTGIAVGGTPLGYYAELALRIEALDEAAIRAAATRFLTTETVQIAIVGDADAVREPLRALGIGETTVRPAP